MGWRWWGFSVLIAISCAGEANGSGPISSGTSVREESEERSSMLRPLMIREAKAGVSCLHICRSGSSLVFVGFKGVRGGVAAVGGCDSDS